MVSHYIDNETLFADRAGLSRPVEASGLASQVTSPWRQSWTCTITPKETRPGRHVRGGLRPRSLASVGFMQIFGHHRQAWNRRGNSEFPGEKHPHRPRTDTKNTPTRPSSRGPRPGLHRPLLGPQTWAPGCIRSAAALLPVASALAGEPKKSVGFPLGNSVANALESSQLPGSRLCASARTSSVVSASSALTSSAASEKSKTSTSDLSGSENGKRPVGHLQVPGVLLNPGGREALENNGVASQKSRRQRAKACPLPPSRRHRLPF